eukprot:g558.t1.2.5e174188 g558  g558.t1 contig10:287473-288035(-)
MMIIFCVYSLILSMLINIFAPLLSIQYPRLVTPSYILAFGYCLADAGSAGYRILTEEDSATQDVDKRSNQTRAAIATFDTLLWQSLASVAIPGGVINMVVKASRFAVARSVGLPAIITKWLPTASGLGSIPFIITPIDNAVDFALDNSTRKYLNYTE